MKIQEVMCFFCEVWDNSSYRLIALIPFALIPFALIPFALIPFAMIPFALIPFAR